MYKVWLRYQLVGENAWLVDLENDGLLDLVVTITSAGSGSYGTVTMYQKRGNQFVSRPLAPLSPPPNPDASKEYRGHDAFEVKDGHLFWSFPLYEANDSNANPTGGVARHRYSLADEKWEMVLSGELGQ